jgi:hypothetical protein
MIEFKELILLIANNKIFPKKTIRKILQVPCGILVLTDGISKSGSLEERNVFFINLDGSIKWQIQHLGLPKHRGYQGYITLDIDTDGKIQVVSFRGVLCEVNIDTGELLGCVSV